MRYLFILISSFFIVACGNDAPNCDSKNIKPVELFDKGFNSQISVETFQERFMSLRILEMKSEDKTNTPPCPTYLLQTVSVAYEHYGQEGEVRFIFYNAQLTTARFYPKNEEQYLKTLCEKASICMENKESMTKGNVLIVKKHDEKNTLYIGWEDICLMQIIEAGQKNCK